MPKNAFISTLVFASLSFIPAAAGIFLLPLYLQKLSAEEFAILNLVNVFAGLAAMFGNLKLDAAIRTFYFDFEEKSREQNAYLSKIFSFSTFLLLLSFFGLCLLGPNLFTLLFKSKEIHFYPFGFYALAAAFLALFRTPYMIFLKNRIHLKEFAAYNLGEFGLILGLQAIFILVMGWGLVGALLGLLWGQIGISSIFLIFNFKLIQFSIKQTDVLPSLKYSVLLLPFVLMNWALLRGDRIFFERLSNLEEVAKYALLMTIVGLSRFIFNALDNAIRPFLFPLFKEAEQQQVSIANFHKYYVGIYCLFLAALLMLGHLLPLFTDKSNYLSIIPYFAWACLALIPSIWVRMYNLQLVFAKKSQLISLYGTIQFAVLIFAFYSWVPSYGISGALAAIGLSNLVAMFIFVGLARSYTGLQIPLFQGKTMMLMTIISIGLARSLNELWPTTAIDYELAVFPFLLSCFLALNFSTIQEALSRSSLKK
ncbi:MAG: hypothetical protein AAF696_03990 [Bacteroidota bacterium]